MIKKYKLTLWENRPDLHTPITVPNTEALMPLEEIIDHIFDDKSKQTNVVVGEYKPLICKCCGAPINRETMKCEYCGVQYGK